MPDRAEAAQDRADRLALPAVPAAAAANHPIRDRILVGLFFATLAILAVFDPLHGRQRHVENRTLAPWPDVTLDKGFAARFDAAFSDRFRSRNALIALQHAIVVLGFRTSPGGNVILGRHDWLYFAGEDGHALDRHVRGTMPYSDEEIARLAVELERRRAWLESKGIPYIVMVAPDKATIYPEYLPRWIEPMPGPTPLERAVRLLAANPKLHFVDLRPVLRAAKSRNKVYYRTDSHWNYLGALVAYDALMREIQGLVGARLPIVQPAEMPPYSPGADKYRGDLGLILGVSRRYEEADVAPFAKVLANAGHRCARRVDDGKDWRVETYECDRTPALRAVMLRDSMAIPLIPPLSENFRRIVYVRSSRLDPDLIEREKPDVVIEEFVERGLNGPAATPMP